jgi:hypothetical protein
MAGVTVKKFWMVSTQAEIFESASFSSEWFSRSPCKG